MLSISCLRAGAALLALLPALGVAVVAAAPPSSAASAAANSNNGLCRPLSSEFDFARKPPAKATDLAFCKEYKQSTCCDKSSSMAVLRSLSPYFDPNSEVASSFSERCRQVSSVVGCAPCHPDVGVGRRMGLCPALCEEWFSACSEGLYADSPTGDGTLKPCTDSSLVCAPLASIVRNGQEMCTRTGVGAGSLTRQQPHSKVSDEVDRLLQKGKKQRQQQQQRQRQRKKAKSDAAASTGGEESGAGEQQDAEEEEEEYDPDDDVACFDGSIPAASGRGSSSSASDAASSSGGSGRDSPKKFYKTAEELSEIERRRSARAAETAARQAQAEWDGHPAVVAARQVAGTIQGFMRPLQQQWRKMVRQIPLIPRSVARTLEGPFVFSLALLALNVMLWTTARTWMERCCGGRRGGAQRQPGGAAPAGTPGWSVELHPDGSSTSSAAAFSTLSSSGLSAKAVRQARAEKLMEQQYAKQGNTSSSNNDQSSGGDSIASASAAADPDTYTAIIDGELITLPKK